MRLENNKNLNQTKKISFLFDGKKYVGYKGDTLASALLSNGVRLFGRSFKLLSSRGCRGKNQPRLSKERLREMGKGWRRP